MQNSVLGQTALLSQSEIIRTVIWPFSEHLTSISVILTGCYVICAIALVAIRSGDINTGRKWIVLIIIANYYFSLVGSSLVSMLIQVLHQWISGTKINISFVRGSAASLGAFIVQIAVLWSFSRTKAVRAKFFELLDFFAGLSFVSLGLNRIGCYFAGCCYGRPMHSPLFGGRYPTQLFSLGMACISYWVWWWLYGKRKEHPAGTAFFSSMVVYGCLRVFVEGFRADSVYVVGGITLAQITFTILTVVAAFFLIRINKRSSI